MDTTRFTIEHRIPPVEDYLRLREVAGLTPRDRASAEAGLPNSSVAVVVTEGQAIVGMGRVIGDGALAPKAHPALDFMLRAWAPIAPKDLPILLMIGVVGLLGSYLLSQAYRLNEAAFAAAFEYLAMPMAIVWGVTVFGTWPDAWAWTGSALILGSGIFLVLREAAVKGRTIPIHATRR